MTISKLLLVLIIIILPIKVIGQNAANIDTTQVYFIVDSMPTMPEGDDIASGFVWLFNQEFGYPDSLECELISKIIFEFVISYDGRITDKKISFRPDLQDCENDYNKLRKEGLRFLNKFPKCNPGKNNGKFVKVKFVVPVHIHLQ